MHGSFARARTSVKSASDREKRTENGRGLTLASPRFPAALTSSMSFASWRSSCLSSRSMSRSPARRSRVRDRCAARASVRGMARNPPGKSEGEGGWGRKKEVEGPWCTVVGECCCAVLQLLKKSRARASGVLADERQRKANGGENVAMHVPPDPEPFRCFPPGA